MTNKRTFYNVGFALFAVEKVSDKYTVVYDCGGQTEGDINNAIDRAFPQNPADTETKPVVEALFISHYDRDHINGVFELLNHCKVKRLILPSMSDSDKLIVLFDNDSEFTEDEVNFITDPQSVIEETRITYVNEEGTESTDDNNTIYEFDEANSLPNSINSGVNIKFNNVPWVFIPWNIRTFTIRNEATFISNIKQFIAEHLSISLDTLASADIKDLWEKTKGIEREIKNRYLTSLSINKDQINSTSQVLYSGPLPFATNRKNGCLYLGDYDAANNFDVLKKKYNHVWNGIGAVQIPHHGSPKNFNIELINPNIKYSIISARPLCERVRKNPDYQKILIDITIAGGIPLVTGCHGDIEIYTERWEHLKYR